MNGSSYRFYVRKAEGPDPDRQGRERVRAIQEEESRLELETGVPYKRFRQNVEKIRGDLVSFIRQENRLGKRIIGYGASTKGNVILQYCGLTARDVPYLADRNPLKWGGWSIGSDIPIISEEEARRLKPDYFLVLPYYFMDEMIPRERQFLEDGGKFIVPVPQLRIVDSRDLTP